MHTHTHTHKYMHTHTHIHIHTHIGLYINILRPFYKSFRCSSNVLFKYNLLLLHFTVLKRYTVKYRDSGCSVTDIGMLCMYI